MGRKSLENFCNKLFANLIEEFIFFIPENIFFTSELDSQNLPAFKSYFQKVIYMDHIKGPLLYNLDRKGPDMIVKSGLLTKNTLGLIENNEQLSSSNFNYILNNYLDQVKGLAFISDWMNDQDRLIEVAGIDSKARVNFNLQSELFEKHLDELSKTFKTGEIMLENNESVIKDLKLQVPKLIEQIKNIGETQLVQVAMISEFVQSAQKNVTIKPKEVLSGKKLKPILITENEAEEFLLATIFGIKLQQ